MGGGRIEPETVHAMERANEPEHAATPSTPAAGSSPGPPAPAVGPPNATNSWARRTILSRALNIDLPPDLAKKVGNVGLWYYNRILLTFNKKGALDQELPPSTNRYLVPISLALACDYLNHHVDLERLLRISGTPTRKTSEHAHRLYARFSTSLKPVRKPVPARHSAPPAPAPAGRVPWAASTPSAPASRGPSMSRPAATHPPRVPSPRAAPAAAPAPTALARPLPEEILQLRSRFAGANSANDAAKPGARPPRQHNTNAWARKRITDWSRTLALPERVRTRSLEFYERIVDLHTTRAHAPPGKKVQLSPRLNWSLVYTTIYLACRFEEYPKDLRDILGRTPPPGSMREMYRLYRFYKRELKLEIKLVDVRTFIQSWLDGFELSELVYEKAASGETAWLGKRAIAIADRARGAVSLRSTSTKIIAAGAFTTALAERNPPGNLARFYAAVAGFLHMSEETIRLAVARIAAIL